MLRVASSILLLAACVGPDSGHVVDACTDCGPGDLVLGRFVSADWRVYFGASVDGVTARTLDDHLAWLGPDLAVDREVPIASPLHGAMKMRGPVVGPSGDVVTDSRWHDRFFEYSVLQVYAVDGKLRFEHDIGRSRVAATAVGPSQIFVVADTSANVPIEGQDFAAGSLIALDRLTGHVTWSLTIPGGVVVDIAAMPDGGVAMHGSFVGTLALGGTAPVLQALDPPTESSFLGALDAAGRGRWALRTDVPDPDLNGVRHIAAGPHGEVGFVAEWVDQEPIPFAIGDVAIAPAQKDSGLWAGRAIGVVDATGALSWLRPLGWTGVDVIFSLATDGTEVIIAGNYRVYPLPFGASPTPDEDDGFIGAVDATGVRWVQTASGLGSQRCTVLALTADRVVVSINSFRQREDDAATLSYGSVHEPGEGVVIGELAR